MRQATKAEVRLECTILGRGGREFSVVRGDLFGVVLTVAPVNHFVTRQSGWMEFAFWGRNQVEMAVPVAPPRQAGAHPRTAGQPAMRRNVADADTDTAMGRPVGVIAESSLDPTLRGFESAAQMPTRA